MFRSSRGVRPALALASAALLILSCPGFDLGILAWVALVPLLLLLERAQTGEGLALSYVAGVLSFGGMFYSVWYVPAATALGILLLYGYFGLYLLLWGAAVLWVRKTTGWALAVVAPVFWVIQEYVRGHLLFFSFPFMLLGHSQYAYSSVIQVTAVVGTYGLSFLIVLVNAVIAEGILSLQAVNWRPRRRITLDPGWLCSLAVATVALVGSLVFGAAVVSEQAASGHERIALVQGNVPRSQQWEPAFRDDILATYERLTRRAARLEPSLIVWPESAVPGDVRHNDVLRQRVGGLAKGVGHYLLVGSAESGKFQVTSDPSRRGPPKVSKGTSYNTMVLFSPAGELVGHYRKIGLVPFGEYVPLAEYIDWPAAIASTRGNHSPGTEFTVFDLEGARFGAMICWEVMFHDLFREFIRHGADFMINASNEIYFGDSVLSHQYLAVSAVMAAQHRTAVVRVGNSGVSAIVDPYGRITDRLTGAGGRELFVEGFLVAEIPLSNEMTLYTRYGEWFVLLQAVLAVALILFAALRRWLVAVSPHLVGPDSVARQRAPLLRALLQRRP